MVSLSNIPLVVNGHREKGSLEDVVREGVAAKVQEVVQDGHLLFLSCTLKMMTLLKRLMTKDRYLLLLEVPKEEDFMKEIAQRLLADAFAPPPVCPHAPPPQLMPQREASLEAARVASPPIKFGVDDMLDTYWPIRSLG